MITFTDNHVDKIFKMLYKNNNNACKKENIALAVSTGNSKWNVQAEIKY